MGIGSQEAKRRSAKVLGEEIVERYSGIPASQLQPGDQVWQDTFTREPDPSLLGPPETPICTADGKCGTIEEIATMFADQIRNAIEEK